MRWTAACAYFALAIQFVLSFGHLHIGASAGFPQSALLLVQSADQAADFGPDPRPQPNQPTGHACPICILIHLAGSMVLVSAPSPSALLVVTGMARTVSGERVPAPAVPVSFQARAPPIA
jgi:hypothetical protein